jgi:hypothetical protein
MIWQQLIPPDLQTLYEIHDYRHAAAILVTEFPAEFNDMCDALRQFRFTVQDVLPPAEAKARSPRRSLPYSVLSGRRASSLPGSW